MYHTIFDADVFDRIGLPQLLVLVTVTHEREEDLLHDELHVRLHHLPRQRVADAEATTHPNNVQQCVDTCK